MRWKNAEATRWRHFLPHDAVLRPVFIDTGAEFPSSYSGLLNAVVLKFQIPELELQRLATFCVRLKFFVIDSNAIAKLLAAKCI